VHNLFTVTVTFGKYTTSVVLLLGLVFNLAAQPSKLDSLNALVPQRTGTELLSLYVKLGREYIYVSPAKSVEFGEKAIALGNELKEHSKDGIANLLVGAGYLFAGDFEKGKSYTDKGLAIARKNNNVEDECTGLNSLGVYYMNTGDYKQAGEIFHQTLDKAVAAKLTERAAMVTFNLGAIYTNQGKWAEGLNAFQDALKYFTQIGNKKFIARCMMNIAVNYHTWRNLDKALEFYEKADSYFETLDDNMGRVASLNNIGEIYKDKKNYQEAIKYYTRSLNLAIKVSSKLNEAVAYLGLAEANVKLKNIWKASQLAHQALELMEPMDMVEGIARSKWILGEVEFLSGDYNSALKYAGESAALAKKAGIPDIIVLVTSLQSNIYSKMNKYKEAHEYLEKYSLLKDSLYNDEQGKRLAALQTELDVKLKENEIVLLQKENEIKDLLIVKQKSQKRYLLIGIVLLTVFSGAVVSLNRSRKKAYLLLDETNKRISEQHQELVKVNETKNRFLSIIGHDLRNPIGAFKEVLGQLVESPEMFDEELRSQILAELKDEADSTYYLLDNLLFWARTQKESMEFNPEKVDLKAAIDNNILLNSRFSENKGIKLNVEGKYNYSVLFDKNMLNLILRNLISNAVKFSFPDQTVSVSVVDEGELVRVCVADNGVGIDEEKIPYLFDSNSHVSTFGTANEKGSGLGLMLCHEFIKNDGGEIKILSKKGTGTTVCFTLRQTKA